MPLSPNGYEAILFDLDGTIRHLAHSPVELFFEFCADLGLHFDDEAPQRLARWQHVYWADNDTIGADRELGEQEFWVQFMRRQLRLLEVTGDVEGYAREIDRRFRAAFELRPGIIHDDVVPTLRTLRAAGYTVALVSNRSEPLEQQVTELSLEGLFHFTLSAGEAGSWKPDPGIFEQAIAMAGAPADATVYVGDNYYADVVGARGVGITPVLIDPNGIFPEADCDRIVRIGDMLDWLATD